MKPENINTAIPEIARDIAGIWKNIFTTIARISSSKPIIRNLPMNEKSLLLVVAIPESTKNIVAVPPAANPTI